MEHKISIELHRAWDTLDDAAEYFETLASMLKTLNDFPDPPTQLFLDVEVGKDPSEHTISIRNL